MHDARTVTLEIITGNSINRLLNTNTAVGVVPSMRRRHSDVSSTSFVRLWANNVSIHLMTLAKYVPSGQIIVIGCAKDTQMEVSLSLNV